MPYSKSLQSSIGDYLNRIGEYTINIITSPKTILLLSAASIALSAGVFYSNIEGNYRVDSRTHSIEDNLTGLENTIIGIESTIKEIEGDMNYIRSSLVGIEDQIEETSLKIDLLQRYIPERNSPY